MNIERARSENAKRRPILLALDALKRYMTDDQKTRLQHDLDRDIVWFSGTRIIERGPGGLLEWRQLEGLPNIDEVKAEHARLLAAARM